jgi:hypothetical protein
MKMAHWFLACMLPAASQEPHESPSATLLEAIEHEPCDYYCGPLNHPTTAYCIDIDGQIVVGERAGLLWFGETDEASMRNLAGKKIKARFDEGSIWIGRDQRTIRIKRGSNFENFKDPRCLVEVHKPKLAIAAKASRPRNVPAAAVALAGEQREGAVYKPVFVWFSCAASPNLTTIDCMKWYPDGTSGGVESYCARTEDGAPIPADFRIDPLASRERRILLTSGGILQYDHRGRVNDQLIRPGEACY